MYLFDRSLRQLVVRELEKIEIAVRAKMIYVFSHQLGPYWYTEPSNIKNYLHVFYLPLHNIVMIK